MVYGVLLPFLCLVYLDLPAAWIGHDTPTVVRQSILDNCIYMHRQSIVQPPNFIDGKLELAASADSMANRGLRCGVSVTVEDPLSIPFECPLRVSPRHHVIASLTGLF